MDNPSHGRVIGIDVSRDWLDVHCAHDGTVQNAERFGDYTAVPDLARKREAVICFFAFYPEAGQSLPAEKLRFLRALTSKRAPDGRKCASDCLT
ncbi:hypothetical protein [Falsirhodobacter xinxiangensis]|uniref:hypothetical protein n=1 Tax=Falsirhodobacter xinxiangensis TaxID=2530049 RepID=UPI00145A4B7E|nr:hypothetical protein [Rhodobacter xinxiangensis]